MDWNAVVWDTARAGGLVAYLLITLSVVLGLALASGWKAEGWPRFITNGLHEHSTTLALVFTAVHSVAVLVDPYMKFTLGEVLVPFTSHYRPIWVALGIVAAYLMIAIWITGKIRPWIGYQVWRKLHYVTFAVFGLATVHGIASGTDTGTWWAFWLYASALIAVIVLGAHRLLNSPAPSGRRVGIAGGLVTAAAAAGTWAVLQPQPPQAVPAGSVQGRTAQPAPPSQTALAFDSPFSGQESLDDGTLLIVARPDQRPSDQVRVELNGSVRRSTFEVRSGHVTYTPSSAAAYQGDISNIEGSQLSALVSTSDGQRLQLVMVVEGINAGQVTGEVSVKPA